MTREEIQAAHPNLKSTFEITSPPDRDYNCISWAVGETQRRWEPDLYYWPAGVARDWRLASVVDALRTASFEPCPNGIPEPGIEKVAVYCETEEEVLHAARQLPNGRWTSKLGDFEDIVHDTLEELEHHEKSYGKVFAFLRRPSAGLKTS